VFVPPRNHYTRVDAIRSTRSVRIELDGVVLAESSSPVMVFETGLPTRYYLNRNETNFDHLIRAETVTSCPYKGKTSGTGRSGSEIPCIPIWPGPMTSRRVKLLPIAGMIAFYNERVDIVLDGQPLERPVTHFFK